MQEMKTPETNPRTTSESGQTDGGQKRRERQKFLSPDHPFQVFMTTVANLMLLNILTLVCSLPVFTAGAAFAAMNGALTQTADGDGYRITRRFFDEFKRDFGDATMLFIIYLPIVAIDLGYAALTLSGLMQGNPVLFGVLVIISLVMLASAVYAALLVTRYENTSVATFRNSLMLAFGYLPRTAISVACFAAMAVGVYVTWPYLGSLAVLFGFSLPAYISVRQILPVLREQEEKQ